MENNSFTMLNEAGEEVKYDVLFTFDNEETNKSYIAYTDNTYDDDGNISVYASTYDPNSSYSWKNRNRKWMEGSRDYS